MNVLLLGPLRAKLFHGDRRNSILGEVRFCTTSASSRKFRCVSEMHCCICQQMAHFVAKTIKSLVSLKFRVGGCCVQERHAVVNVINCSGHPARDIFVEGKNFFDIFDCQERKLCDDFRSSMAVDSCAARAPSVQRYRNLFKLSAKRVESELHTEKRDHCQRLSCALSFASLRSSNPYRPGKGQSSEYRPNPCRQIPTFLVRIDDISRGTDQANCDSQHRNHDKTIAYPGQKSLFHHTPIFWRDRSMPRFSTAESLEEPGRDRPWTAMKRP